MPETSAAAGRGVFAGLRVIDLSPNRVGAQVSQLFADFGADVIQVEPPGGAVIRRHAAYPFWARGKRSIVLDLGVQADIDTLKGLLARADVLVESFLPGHLDHLGLSADDIAAINPRIIHTSVTGFGDAGPYSHAPGYEGLVMAKIGGLKAFQRMSPDGTTPPFVNVPFAGFAASQTAIHGTLAALIEREHSGLGQRVSTSLAQAFFTLDTWAFYEYFITDRWPGAFTKTSPYDELGRPASPLTFMLLVALTKDGRWLQFASVAPHLFANLMKHLGLAWMFTDDQWKGLPVFGDDAAKRQELWTRMLEAARSKTLEEWNAIFDSDPDTFAEQFRQGPVVLDHPQLLHDGMVVELDDTERGRVRQPGPLVKAARTTADVTRSAPTLDEHGSEVRTLATSAATTQVTTPSAASSSTGLPLDGVVILELATLFAAPHGTTLLTDLGARVIKVEPLEGDRIRGIIPFPEAGGLKVMQGKESIAVDMSSEEGVAYVRKIAAAADVVVQGYRAGSMRKIGLDYESIRTTNPDVIYVNAPGYGVDGPYGRKPAYAPSIGAASGIPLGNVGLTVREDASLTMDEVQDGARRLSAASASANAQADGFAALGVATSILFALNARQRGHGGQEIFSSMLNTGAHAMSAQTVTYPGAPEEPAPEGDLRGLGSLYRVYDAREGHVFLAVPSEGEWRRFAESVASHVDLASDERFMSAAARHANTHALIDVLSDLFARRTADEWEAELLPQGVGVMSVWNELIEGQLFNPEFGEKSGYVTTAVHPTFDEYPRLAPFIRFSRSSTQAKPGVLNGQHTDALLAEFGATDSEIADLRERKVVG